MIATKVKVIDQSSKALLALEAWRRAAYIIVTKLHADAYTMIDECQRKRSPIFGAVPEWASKELVGNLEDTLSALCNCQAEPAGEVEGLPDPLAGIS